MAVTETGLRARWAALAADPARARRIQVAGWEREAERKRAAERPRSAPPRVLALAPAPAAAAAPVRRPGVAVRNAAGTARVDLLDEISWWGITAADFSAALAEVPAGDLEVHVNSPGGSVFDGVTIMNMLRQRSGLVTIVVDGLAASAASVVAMAASPGRLFMAPNSTLMIHDAWGETVGNEQDHRDVADVLGRESDNLADAYAARAGRPASTMRDLMRAETWFIGAEAVAAGLADSMLPGDGQVPEPDSWQASVAQWDTKAQVARAGPGRPGTAALRQQAYARYAAQSGRAEARMSPFVAAVFRAGA